MNLSNYLGWDGITTDLVDQLSSAVGVAFAAEGPQGQSITLTRGAGTIAAQNVIVAPVSSSQAEQIYKTPDGQERKGTLDLILIGPRNHATLADFNVQRGDRFRLGTARYEVVLVDTSINGRTEARCVAFQ